ncbi:redoxin domain-containing protein [Haloarcula onubensis]|uniref:thioredoxin-dependent peroxiredoxin n=1 Tax=Haloarcula onubensis TaxID=2950539 RepID=A0ABU2FK15_9EURY|nr:redoxin domain-containing protein [Halomicroarcula sp. S3CR25-11]MDS0281078.1 redoxin domain-containing protein [Halomicroarcula sp. S3CR25-11]
MVRVGDVAPDFTLRGTDGQLLSQYSLSDYADEGYVILSFYMNDFSPVCSDQVCDLDDIDLFQFEENVSMFGISPDYVYSHREYSRQKGLTFPLLSDTKFEVSKDYGVYDAEQESGVRRALFLVDSDRRVQYRWVAEDNWERWDHGTTEALKDRLDQLRA